MKLILVSIVLSMTVLLADSGLAAINPLPYQQALSNFLDKSLMSKEEPNWSKCTICMVYVEMVRDAFNDGVPESGIIGLIKKLVCDSLPGMEEACKVQLDTEIPIVIDILTQDDQSLSHDICTQLDYCPHILNTDLGRYVQAAKRLLAPKTNPTLGERNAQGCSSCEFYVTFIQTMLDDTYGPTCADVEALCLYLCKALPGLEEECRAVVSQDMPVICNMTENKHANQTELCIANGHCP